MFFNEQLAYKYKMSAVQAALVLVQLEGTDELMAKKSRFLNYTKRNSLERKVLF